MCEGTREQAGIVVIVHKSEVINKKADGQANPEGQAKFNNQTKGVSAISQESGIQGTQHRKMINVLTACMCTD